MHAAPGDIVGFYDRHILPRLLDWGCGCGAVTAQRRKIVPLATGRVLEVGLGSGHNLPLYDPAKVSAVVGIDPATPSLDLARRRMARSRVPLELLVASGEAMPLPDASFDTVVVTYTLCSIPGLSSALADMHRVLKPDGRLLFCEHGRAPDASVARLQARLNPLWGKCAGGCHLDRDIPAEVSAGGFSVTMIEQAYLPGAPRFAGYHYIGTARPV